MDVVAACMPEQIGEIVRVVSVYKALCDIA